MRLIALDLVRFFAAMAVMLYHYTARPEAKSFELLSEFTKFGYLGVPIFFIISGYVVSLSAENRTSYGFFVSRVTRLYPAYWACIIFTLFIVYFFGKHQYSLNQILANFTMLNSYLGYGNIDGVYWTLQKEIQFYACIFLLVFFNVFHKIKIWLSIWLLITVTFLFFNQPFFMGWFIAPDYSSLFITGIAFHLIQKYGLTKYNIFILTSALIISSFYTYTQVPDFIKNPGMSNQLIAVALVLFFYFLFFTLVTGKITIKKRNSYLLLGGLTYPLYLIHNMAGKTIIDNQLKNIPEEIAVIITAILVLLFSLVIHLFIEKKLATPLKNNLLKIANKFNHIKSF